MQVAPRILHHISDAPRYAMSSRNMLAGLSQQTETDSLDNSTFIPRGAATHNNDQLLTNKILMIDGGSLNYSTTIFMAQSNGLSVKRIQGTPSVFSTISVYKPDIIICDITVHEPSCQNIVCHTRNRTGRLSSIPIIIAMTSSADRNILLDCLRCGADDYAVHPLDPVVFIEVIRCRLNRPLIYRSSLGGVHLTEREIEAIHWTAQGKSSTVIATIMEISNRTVNYHITNVMKKYDVSTRVQAAIKAYVDGYIAM